MITQLIYVFMYKPGGLLYSSHVIICSPSFPTSNEPQASLSYRGRALCPVEVFLVGAPSGTLKMAPVSQDCLDFSEYVFKNTTYCVIHIQDSYNYTIKCCFCLHFKDSCEPWGLFLLLKFEHCQNSIGTYIC